MKVMILAMGLALMAAGATNAQTIDTQEEAWQIAGRNNVAIDQWDLISLADDSAAFVQKVSAGGQANIRWVALLDADDLTISLGIITADCRTKQYSFTQTTTRDWKGAFLSSSGDSLNQYATPGSVGELMLKHVCQLALIVPGPPRS